MYEELEVDTDPLYLALSEENLEDIILPEKKNEWEAIRSRDCSDSFTANPTGNFLPRTCCTAHREHGKREPKLFKEGIRCSEMLWLCSKTYCCYDRKSNKYKFSSKRLNKRTLEDCGNGPMSKSRKVLEEAVNVTSSNRGLRTVQHGVGTYEQTEKGLSYFYPKKVVEDDGIYKKSSHLWNNHSSTLSLSLCIVINFSTPSINLFILQ